MRRAAMAVLCLAALTAGACDRGSKRSGRSGGGGSASDSRPWRGDEDDPRQAFAPPTGIGPGPITAFDPLDRVMAVAPAGAVGVAYLDVGDVRNGLKSRLMAAGRGKLGPLFALTGLLDKVDWAALWFGRDFQRHGPLVVLHGRATLRDLQAFGEGPDGSPAKVRGSGNGRYSIGGGPDAVIIGDEADDVPPGVVLLGDDAVLRRRIIGSLGRPCSPELRELLRGMNPMAPLWGALVMSHPRDPTMKIVVKAEAYPLGTATSRGTVECPDQDFADKIVRETTKLANEPLLGLAGLLTAEARGKVVHITLRGDRSLPDRLIAAVTNAQKKAHEAMSMSNLHMLGTAIRQYEAMHREMLPKDLAALVKDDMISPKALVSPLSGRRPPELVGGKLAGEVDYIYVPRAHPRPDGKPLSVTRIQSPSEFVLAYERLENYSGERTTVLFMDGSVRPMSAAAFDSALDRTKKMIGGER